MASTEKSTSRADGEQKVAPPSISLPKGGGAIRGMGEKFAANPVTGTGSMTVPIATSPGRSGFGPQLSLSYDSGSGNGPFGFGWSLSLPAITRKTDKGLPKYQDAAESDVFILSGAEDLVPVLVQNGGKWEREKVLPRTVGGKAYNIQRYRPRIEGLFARIERWTNQTDPTDTFWRSISKDNITTWYGKTEESRIADPSDAARIFSWLICESYDDKGNIIVYRYEKENSDNVDLSQAHERNRGEKTDKLRLANRYLKRVRYGYHKPYLPKLETNSPWPSPPEDDQWFFEVAFDYGDHDPEAPTTNKDNLWPSRSDPFSSYRSGFEVRTYRLCQRVLMFHHFPNEAEVGADCLVRSTDFTYSYEENPANARNPIYSFLLSVTQTGYKRDGVGGYLKKSLPPLEFVYTKPEVQDMLQEVDAESLENLPIGLDGASYQWTDLHGEGIPGILTEQGGAWFYKRNLSPLPVRDNGSESMKAQFAPVELVASKPNLTLAGGQAQFMDLAGDGQPDLVVMDDPMPGLYEHDDAEGWQPFRPFTSQLNRDTRDPNLKFVDLDGDGHADVLISEDDAFVWHPSLAEEGFGPARRVHQALDEEKAPRLVFADGTQSIYLADMSGDGLTDIIRIRNGEVCYWPNLGYGRFGSKVTMDRAPHFDHPDQFDQKRIRLADIDGSGTTDIIYLHRNGVRLYFNQSGNAWSDAVPLPQFSPSDNVSSVQALDLLGNGTACLVWSSPLPPAARRPMRYLALMAEKPHLLVGVKNNLGAESRVQYAPSTKFYLADKQAGKPWITRLPFPVHVVERVETYDHISRNHFVTRYAYHHGYFDGEEREFRGFGMVEQFDTEEFAALTATGTLPDATNVDKSSHVPPVLTKTWFHTGAYLDGSRISKQCEQEYYREGDPSLGEGELTDEQLQAMLLPDTILPDGLTAEEAREACRSLKGAILRQEIYACDRRPDGTLSEESDRPYSVSERNYTIKRLQPRDDKRYAVFFTHPRETIDFHYERKLVDVQGKKRADPRVSHAFTLRVDEYGNVERSVAIGYRRRDVPDLRDPEQKDTHLTLTVSRFANRPDEQEWYRVGLPVEARTFEIVKPPEPQVIDGLVALFTRTAIDALAESLFPSGQPAPDATNIWPYEKLDWRRNAANAPPESKLRLIEHVRTLYRPDDCGAAQNDPLALLPLGTVDSLALPGESYKLAFTPGLLTQVFQRNGQPLLPSPADVLNGQGTDRGGYVDLDGNGHWWIPSGRVFYSPNAGDDASTELAHARSHFFPPHRYRDPFHTHAVSTETIVTYDTYDLLVHETRDALGNQVTVGERRRVLPDDTVLPEKRRNDYRVLQPALVMDPNRNRTEVAFDALGMVVGTAVMGKPEETLGDLLDASFKTDLTTAEIPAFMEKPRKASANPKEGVAAQIVHDLLQKATTRIVYDLDRYKRLGEPPFAATIARETHVSALPRNQKSKLQLSFSYSDGFGREIQKKIQAESGPVPQRNANGKIIVGTDGQPIMTPNDVSPRWVGSGWTVFNNKGKPVRQYEPFFTDTHRFEFEPKIGVSPVLFYDPVERVVATLHPNNTYEKVVFDPWRQATYDVNDTINVPKNPGDPPFDPKNDPDVGDYFRRLPDAEYLPTWYDVRTDPTKALEAWPDSDANNAKRRTAQKDAANKASVHANTPTVAYLDTLGRPFLTIVINRFERKKPDDTTEIIEEPPYHTRIELDIEGNQREVIDAKDRVVMRYDYDMLGNRIHQLSMEAGARWMLNDVAGKPIRAWDSRGHNFTTACDALRRPVEQTVRGTTTESDPRTLNRDIVVDKIEYGEPPPNATDAQEREAQRLNLRTRIYRHFDSAGIATNARLDANGDPTEAYDFKGNLLRSTRRLVSDYTAIPNWLLNPQLNAETFEGRTLYDALNRPIQSIAPHSSLTRAQHPNKFNVIQPVFNEANLLERVDVWLERAAEPASLLDPYNEAPSPVGVADIDYDAKGQRLRIDYKNGTSTFYDYDKQTFRLTQLLTRRNPAVFPDDCPEPPPVGWPGCRVQNLHYTYDPTGNITHIRDDAQQTIYFKNKRVEPSNDYVYDALYRLIQASGREHLGQEANGDRKPPTSPDAFNAFHTRLDHPGNGEAMGTYTERYVYDAVGNFLQMQHRGTDPAHSGWTRAYDYVEPSLIEDGNGGAPLKTSNRLTRTTLNPAGNNPQPESYLHDAHGNMVHMPHLGGGLPGPNMHWDYKDQLRQTDLGGGGAAYYVYDASGQRVRKVWEKAPGLTEERIYLGGFEIFRSHGGPIGANTATLERETLHIMDDKQRIALVEMRTRDAAGDDPAPQQLIRYQYGNHLGSASLELDDQAQIISYEEYAPYGSTTYQAVRSQTETAKRYRYTGKERDGESGLYYHGARYYAPWLGRWTTCDPIGIADGINQFAYCRLSPVVNKDWTGRNTTPSEIGGPFGPSGTYQRLETAPKSTREHLIPGRQVYWALVQQYGASRVDLIYDRVYNNMNATLLDNSVAAPKTVGDNARTAGLRSDAGAGRTTDLTGLFVQNKRNIVEAAKATGINLTPAQIAGIEREMMIQMATAVKSEDVLRDSAQGKPIPKKLASKLRPTQVATGSSTPKTSAPDVVVTRFTVKPTAVPTVPARQNAPAPATAKAATPARGGNAGGKVLGAIGVGLTLRAVATNLKEGDLDSAAWNAASLNPAVSTALTLKAAHDEFTKGNTAAGTLEVASLNPVVGAARSGWQIGRALDDEYQLGETALTWWGDKLADMVYND